MPNFIIYQVNFIKIKLPLANCLDPIKHFLGWAFMNDMFRSKGGMTRLRLLLGLVVDRPKDQRSLSEPAGITPQAVSEHLRSMEAEGLVDLSGPCPVATVKGVDMLHHNLLRLKAFVDSNIQRLDIIRSTDAIAASEIIEGDQCSLFMRGGLLFAARGVNGSSTGRADSDASDGEMVSISDLSGVLDIEKGSVLLVEIAPARSGGGKGRIARRDIIALWETAVGKAREGQGSFKVAGLDLEAVALLARSGTACDLELPVPEELVSKVERGIDIMALGTPHSVSRYHDELRSRSIPNVSKSSFPSGHDR